MKTTARVFTIIGIVANSVCIGILAIYLILLLAAGQVANDEAVTIGITFLIPMYIIFIVLMILGIVFGTKTLNKLKTATSKSQIIVWAVLDLIFCNAVGGILILCLRDSDFIPTAVETPSETASPDVNIDSKE